MNLGIKGKIALVTGASKGIGRAIALKLAEEGARVVIVARTADALNNVLGQLDGASSDHKAFVNDLMAPGGTTRLFKDLEAGIGLPDIVVHNLGGSMGVFQTMASTEDWNKVWQFNVGIVHELNRLFLPSMVDRKWGRVVHLSTLSTTTFNGAAAYVSAKCALDGYVKAVNREFSKNNVILSAVAPGAIYSEGRHFAKLTKENPAALQDYFRNHLPIQRLGTAEDVAPVVAFLCSEHASFLAGTIVGIDGGGM
jgi:NAD(P)-dependent dehydrogenase (short-subunit alcohol dehydrogenase family)